MGKFSSNGFPGLKTCDSALKAGIQIHIHDCLLHIKVSSASRTIFAPRRRCLAESRIQQLSAHITRLLVFTYFAYFAWTGSKVYLILPCMNCLPWYCFQRLCFLSASSIPLLSCLVFFSKMLPGNGCPIFQVGYVSTILNSLFCSPKAMPSGLRPQSHW